MNRREVKVKVVVPPPQPTEVHLTLTEEQAKALIMVLGGIGGSPTSSRRGYIEDIYRGLEAAGIVSEKFTPKDPRDYEGTGYFKDCFNA